MTVSELIVGLRELEAQGMGEFSVSMDVEHDEYSSSDVESLAPGPTVGVVWLRNWAERADM